LTPQDASAAAFFCRLPTRSLRINSPIAVEGLRGIALTDFRLLKDMIHESMPCISVPNSTDMTPIRSSCGRSRSEKREKCTLSVTIIGIVWGKSKLSSHPTWIRMLSPISRLGGARCDEQFFYVRYHAPSGVRRLQFIITGRAFSFIRYPISYGRRPANGIALAKRRAVPRPSAHPQRAAQGPRLHGCDWSTARRSNLLTGLAREFSARSQFGLARAASCFRVGGSQGVQF
jgi:hypothetical protein